LSPATALALLALFVALGGSALAVGKAVKPVVRCGNGSVKGYAAVNLDSFVGAFPTTYASAANLFDARYDCAGGSPQVRKVGSGVYDVRFPGVTPKTAAVSAYGAAHPGWAYWSHESDGSIRVTVVTPSGDPSEFGFSVTVF
jgi:hypothetical protein